MARPRKIGLDYFPLDVDFFDDEKIVAISGEFGLKGELTAIKLLCAVYRNGYYIEWTDMLKMKMLRSLPGMSVDLLDSILNRLVRWAFFDKTLFDSVRILTSRGIQKRYFNSVKKRLPETEYPYLLISVPSNTVPKDGKKKDDKVPEPKKVISKTTRQERTGDKPMPVEDEAELMKHDAVWAEPVCMRFHLNTEQMNKLLDDFVLHCKCIEKTHDDISDAKRHFCLWLNAKQNQQTGKTARQKQQPTIPPKNDDYTFNGGFGGKDT